MSPALNRSYRWASTFFFSATIFVLLLMFARIYTNTQDIQKAQRATAAAQARACALRHAGRASENREMRVPVKGALAYLGNVVRAGEKAQPDPVKRAAAEKFAKKFLSYAAAIHILPNPPC